MQLRYEGEPTADGATTFAIEDPSGNRLLTATVDSDDLAATRTRWQSATRSAALIVLAVTLLLCCGPLVDLSESRSLNGSLRHRIGVDVWRDRDRARHPACHIAGGLVGRACLLRCALYLHPASRRSSSRRSIFCLLQATALALVTLLLFAIESLRLHGRQHRRAASDAPLPFVIMQLVAGLGVAAVFLAHLALLRDTITDTSLDLLHFSLHSWDTSRLVMQVGLLMAHASAMGLAVVILRAALHRWRLPRTDWRMWSVTLIAWAVPSLTLQLTMGQSGARAIPLLAAILVAIALAATAGRLAARYRHGSQAFRLTLLTLPMIAPAFAFYPTVVQLARDAKEEFIETSYAPQVRNLRQNVQMQVQQSLAQIDAFPDLVDLITLRLRSPDRSCVPGLAEHRTGQLPDHVFDRTLRPERQARESIRIQPAGRPDCATNLRGAVVRVGPLR